MTETFNGERLAQALTGRRVSARSLALVLGGSEGDVLDYVQGASQPAPEATAMMALFLGLPARFFHVRPEPPTLSGPVFERSLSEATQPARDSARLRHSWLVELLAELQRHIRLPEVNVPNFGVEGRWREIEAVGCENLARATRRHWGLGDNPISNVHLLVENNGVVVTTLDFNCHELGGFCYRDGDGRPHVVLSSDRESGAWSRIDAAHELGHLVMHGGVLAGEIDDEAHTLLERQAARFARAFLMPRDTFGKEVVRPRMVVFQRLTVCVHLTPIFSHHPSGTSGEVSEGLCQVHGHLQHFVRLGPPL